MPVYTSVWKDSYSVKAVTGFFNKEKMTIMNIV